MRQIWFFSAVAILIAAALPSPADAYCRGCTSAEAAAAGAAAGAIIGQTIAKDGPRAFEPPPIPDSPEPTFQRSTGGGSGKDCHTEIQRNWDSDRGMTERRVEVCN